MKGTEVKCSICNREMIEGLYNDHHLIPSTFGGKEKITLHIICHDKLHHTFSEREMVNYYHTIERLLEHEEIKKFVKWVSKKDINYYSKNKDTKKRKIKRR